MTGASRVLASLAHHLRVESPQYLWHSWGDILTLASTTGFQAATNLLPGQREGGLELLHQVFLETLQILSSVEFFNVETTSEQRKRPVLCWYWSDRDHKTEKKTKGRLPLHVLFSSLKNCKILILQNDYYIIFYEPTSSAKKHNTALTPVVTGTEHNFSSWHYNFSFDFNYWQDFTSSPDSTEQDRTGNQMAQKQTVWLQRLK